MVFYTTASTKVQKPQQRQWLKRRSWGKMRELLSGLNFAWPGQGKTFAELPHTIASGNLLPLRAPPPPPTSMTTPTVLRSPASLHTSCNHPHMRWWHLAPSSLAHVIMLSSKQAYLAPGQRGWGTLFMEAGDRRGWSEVGVNEAPTESYHLERFWHAVVVAAAYAPADGSSRPPPGLDSREGSVCRSVKSQRSSQWKL